MAKTTTAKAPVKKKAPVAKKKQVSHPVDETTPADKTPGENKSEMPASGSKTAKVELSEISASNESHESHESPESSELSESHENNESDESDEPVVIVIPYKQSAASGDELLYALRSWAKNLPAVEIVIIGDFPSFGSEQLKHIPAVVVSDNPQVDVAAKLMQAIASDLVPESFILSNDDIYLVNPISIKDLFEPKCAGILGETKKKSNPSYMSKILATKEILEKGGFSKFDYSTHLPFAYSKKHLAEVIQKYRAEETGLLISSLYFNTLASKDFVPEVTKGNAAGDHVVYVYRENPNLEVVEHGFTNRKFVNHNSAGYLPVLPFLEKYFPDKSRFEK